MRLDRPKTFTGSNGETKLVTASATLLGLSCPIEESTLLESPDRLIEFLFTQLNFDMPLPFIKSPQVHGPVYGLGRAIGPNQAFDDCTNLPIGCDCLASLDQAFSIYF